MSNSVNRIRVHKLVDYMTEIDITHYTAKKKLYVGQEIAFEYKGKWINGIITEIGNQNIRIRVLWR